MSEPHVEKQKPVPPFVQFCCAAVPMVFDDSLSYYEALCAMWKYLDDTVKVINNNALVTEDFIAKVDELHDYVEHYFDNLDVQEEINNKLDQMVIDGSFQAILNTYVQPKLDELDNKIDTEISAETAARVSGDNTLQSQIDSLGSGSPLVASDVSEMVNTDRIYVNTTDGKWYYYDGDSWEIGGTYQATGIADNSVTLGTLYSDISNGIKQVADQSISYSSGFHPGYYANNNGVLTSYVNGCCLEVSVNAKETYLFNSFYNSALYVSGTNLYLILDEDNNVIQHEAITESVNEVLTRTITIPEGGVKLLINSVDNTSVQTLARRYGITVFKMSSFIQKEPISYEQFDTTLKNLYTEVYTDFDNSDLTVMANGIMNATMQINENALYTTYSLAVTPGEKFKFHTYKFYSQIPVFGGSKDCIYDITSTGGVTYHTHGNCIRYNDADASNTYLDLDVVIPEGCDILYINRQNDKDLTIKKFTKLDVNMTNQGDVLPNPLNSKVLLFNGDSISSSTASTDSQIITPIAPEDNRAWVARVQQNNPTCTCYGYAVHGSTIAKRDGHTDSILERTATMYAEHSNADYIILEGGINDVFVNVPLGTVSSGYNAVLDDTTFCGALESLFKYAQSNWQGKKIGFINLYKVPVASGQAAYSDKVIEICKKWQIPVLNLFDDSNLNFYIDDIARNFSQVTELAPNGDKLHPNSAGYNVLQNRIESWIKSL